MTSTRIESIRRRFLASLRDGPVPVERMGDLCVAAGYRSRGAWAGWVERPRHGGWLHVEGGMVSLSGPGQKAVS